MGWGDAKVFQAGAPTGSRPWRGRQEGRAQRALSILARVEGLGSQDKFMATGSQLVAAQSLLLDEGWLGGPQDSGLGTTPCCWWSRGCSGCSRCCGWCYCSPRRPGQPPPPRAPACRGDLGAGVEVRAPARAPHSPRGFAGLPQVVVEGS